MPPALTIATDDPNANFHHALTGRSTSQHFATSTMADGESRRWLTRSIGRRCSSRHAYDEACNLLAITSMARIRAVQRQSTTVVTVSGRLSARDMRRLEHACSPALTTAEVQLTVDLTRVTEVDRAAEMLLRRMVARGAKIKTDQQSPAAQDE